MKAELSDHLEEMDHEISGLELQISYKGYRVDGDNGIKKVVCLNHRKSVDYFYIKNDKCLFIEFTDEARGQEDLIGLDDSISQVASEFHLGKLRKLIKNDKRDEMLAKFKDSRDIFSKIPDYFQNIPTAFLSQDAKTFYIVHIPINESLSEENKAAIARYMTGLSARISGCLEDEICERVKLVLLADFINELG
ncbi:MAG: hypothetical protein GQ583_00795 [Methyloprofundus sp.]|nr:hypothetical protein [Methyloprofundus sp.]